MPGCYIAVGIPSKIGSREVGIPSSLATPAKVVAKVRLMPLPEVRTSSMSRGERPSYTHSKGS